MLLLKVNSMLFKIVGQLIVTNINSLDKAEQRGIVSSGFFPVLVSDRGLVKGKPMYELIGEPHLLE